MARFAGNIRPRAVISSDYDWVTRQNGGKPQAQLGKQVHVSGVIYLDADLKVLAAENLRTGASAK